MNQAELSHETLKELQEIKAILAKMLEKTEVKVVGTVKATKPSFSTSVDHAKPYEGKKP